AAGPDRHCADLCTARHLTAAEIPLRSVVRAAALVRARRAADPAVVLDYLPWHVGEAGEEVLIDRSVDAALRDGHYAAKQIFCKDRLIAWSHKRRFAAGLRLMEPWAGKRILDYGCGDGTFLGLLCRGAHPPASAVGAEIDDVQVNDCRS